MNNEIGLLVQDLPQEDADRYIKETKSSFDRLFLGRYN